MLTIHVNPGLVVKVPVLSGFEILYLVRSNRPRR
jgi:hypothetical protein